MLFLLLGDFSAFAAGETATVDSSAFQFHGFLSQGAIKTTDNNFLLQSKTGSLDYTEAGLNFTKGLADSLRMGMQLFVQRLGSGTSLDSKLDWAYMDYHPNDRFGIRFGRVKTPFGLYNDVVDIDSARVPILLPQSVYPASNRNFFLAEDGAEIYGYTGTGSAGALEYRLYGGTMAVPFTNTVGAPIAFERLDTPYLIGARLMWDTPLEGFHVSTSLQTLRFDINLQAGGTTEVSLKFPATLWVTSLRYSHNDLAITAEYERIFERINDSTNTALFKNGATLAHGGYGMVAYRFTDWLQPGLYFSTSLPNLNLTSGRESHQDDLALTLRFDINPYWII
ncbi:MAG TPA: porin, partial [Bdellovibrionota bacterium]|nr:porin [Bdellovibrionota bacterium]